MQAAVRQAIHRWVLVARAAATAARLLLAGPVPPAGVAVTTVALLVVVGAEIACARRRGAKSCGA